MLTRVCFSLALLLAVPACAQAPAAQATDPVSGDDDLKMVTPPPVSGEAYPAAVGAETRSNYLDIGAIVTTAYDDNVPGSAGSQPVADAIYTIWPTVTLDQASWRQRRTFTYSPGFTFYDPTSALNDVDQSADLDFEYRMSPHSTVVLRDTLEKSSNVFNLPNALSGEPVSGSGEPSAAEVVAPYAPRLTDTANAEASYQYSRNSMIGGGGIFTELHYPNPAQNPGLYDSDARGGSAFYSHRLSSNQYAGAVYQYLRLAAYPAHAQSTTQTQSFFGFYTVYLKHSLSLSFLGGPQHYDATQAPLPESRSLTGSGTASLGWQRSHTNIAASYSHSVSGGGGLLGAYTLNSANASVRWQMASTWILGSTAGYIVNKTVTPLFTSDPGGHSINGVLSIEHTISERFRMEAGYNRLHQSYGGIAVIAVHPDSDRVYVSVSYRFTRPLGR